MEDSDYQQQDGNGSNCNVILLKSDNYKLEVSFWCSNEFSEYLHQITDGDFDDIIEEIEKHQNTKDSSMPKSGNVIKDHTKLAKLDAKEINAIYQHKLKILLEMINSERMNRRFGDVVNTHDEQIQLNR